MGFLDSVKGLVGNKPVTQTPSPTTTAAPRKKILIVEDEVDLREFYVNLMKDSGFDAISAENGEIGLETIISQKPTVVILDLIMPVMDGKTMLRKVRDIPEFKTLPVIVLTNAGDTENIRETKFYSNASEFLIKSNVSPEDLINRVKSLAGV